MMAVPNHLKRFSLNTYYNKIDNIMIFYDKNGNRLGRVQFNLYEIEMMMHLSQFQVDSEFFSINLLREILIQFIQTANVLKLHELIIDQFPLKDMFFNDIINIFKMLYSQSIIFSYKESEFKDSVIDLHVKFKHPRITHYVQQAYLRNFSSNMEEWKSKGKIDRARIFCFDKQKLSVINLGNTKAEKTYGVKIKKIAYREYFYSLHL